MPTHSWECMRWCPVTPCPGRCPVQDQAAKITPLSRPSLATGGLSRSSKCASAPTTTWARTSSWLNVTAPGKLGWEDAKTTRGREGTCRKTVMKMGIVFTEIQIEDWRRCFVFKTDACFIWPFDMRGSKFFKTNVHIIVSSFSVQQQAQILGFFTFLMICFLHEKMKVSTTKCNTKKRWLEIPNITNQNQILVPPPSGHYPVDSDLRSLGAEHRARGVLQPPAEAPEVGRDSLAAPGPDGRGGGAALREPSRGGRVEVRSDGEDVPSVRQCRWFRSAAFHELAWCFFSFSGMTFVSDTFPSISWRNSKMTDLR